MTGSAAYRVVAFAIGVAAIAYCAPMFQSLGHLDLIADALKNPDGLLWPLIRSVSFTLITAVLSVVVGFCGAVILAPRARRLPLLTPLLLLPLMGSVFAGLVVHLDMRYPAVYGLVSNRDLATTWGLLILTHLWQFAPLCLFLFAAHLNSVSPEASTFMSVSRASWGEIMRDVYWPHCRNLTRLLTLVAVGEGMREFVKPAMIIRASTGTGTEMVTGRLERYYATMAKVDFETAVQETMGLSLIVTVATAVLALCTIYIIEGFLRFATGRLRGIQAIRYVRKRDMVMLYTVAAIPLIGFVSLFDVSALAGLPWSVLAKSVALASSATAVTILVAILLAITARVGFTERLASFSARAVPAFLVLLTIRLVPPIAIVLCGLDWLSRFHVVSTSATIAVWIGAQLMITFPLLAAFAIFTHFAVRTNEIEFHEVSRAAATEVARDSFLRRFPREYLLIAVFGLSIILSEDAINSIMAFAVPSVAHELSLRIGGRSGSYREAVMIAALASIPVIAAVGMLAFHTRKERSLK